MYGRAFTDEDAREIRRMKARIERERIPPGEDPQFHLKLGRGSLSDVEFTVQLLQLEHGGARRELRVPGTIDALARLRDAALLERDDADALEAAYRFCERARNARYLAHRPAGRRPARRRSESERSGSAARVRPPAALVAARRLPPGHPARPARRRARVLRSPVTDTVVVVQRGHEAGTEVSTRVRRLSMLIVALVMLPFAVSALALLGSAGSRYHPYNDPAIIELQVRHVFDDLPLVGPYSRFDWFHPGPVLYYLLAIPYRLTGATSGSLAFAAVFVNALAVLGILLVARRRGGLPLLVTTAVVTLLLVNGLGPQFARDVWNPHITVLPFLLLVFLAWTMSCGDRWAAPVGAIVASFVVQTHVGYALPALVLAAGGFVGLAWSTRHPATAGDRTSSATPAARSLVRTGVITGAVLSVMWLPTLVEQLDREPGNLGKLVAFFREHGQEQSADDAWHVVASQVGAWPDWVRGSTDLNVIGALDFTHSTPVPLTLVVLVGATVLAWRRGATDALRLDLLTLALIIASFVAVSRIVDDVFPYLVKWTWAVGALAWIAIAWSVITALRGRTRGPEIDAQVARFAFGVGLVAVVALSAACTIDAADAGTPDPITSRHIGQLTDAVERELATTPDDGVVEIRAHGGAGSLWGGAGIADRLDQHGVEVRVAPDLQFAYGPDFVVRPDENVRLLVMPVDAVEAPAVRALGGWEEISRAGGTHLFVRRA